MTAKERFCFNCGESLGVMDWSDRYDNCGKRECEREARFSQQCDEADRRERAEMDNYERY